MKTYLICLFLLLSVLVPDKALALSTNLYSTELSFKTAENPVKPKRKIAKKVKKKPTKKELTFFLLLLIPIGFGIGLALFITGLVLPLFALWLSGLILFGAIDLFLVLIFFISRAIIDRYPGELGAVIYAMIFIILSIVNAILALAFVIVGLSIGNPILWITGAALFLLALLSISGLLFKSEE